MPGSTSADQPVRPAATVIVLRDAPHGLEVFLVRRHAGAAFMGGAHVFPGGRVDEADQAAADPSWCDGLDTAARALPGLGAEISVAHHVAAIRELFEESGILLARSADGAFAAVRDPDAHARFAASRHDLHSGRRTLRDIVEFERLHLALDALTPFAHWVTPPVDVRRFDTWFFVSRVPPHQIPAHDDRETVDSEWIAPAAALARAEAGEIALPPPTWTTLRELEPFGSADAAIAWARGRRIVRREPRAVERGGVRMLLLPGDPENPGDGHDEPPRESRFVLDAGRWRPQAGPAYNPSQGTHE